jgi:LysM repeat protein
MPMPSGFEQARLEIENGKAPSTKVECWFNPTQYSIVKSNTYKTVPGSGKSLPQTQFGGGSGRQLSVELLFDASPDGDVSAVTNQLFQMMEVDPKLGTSGPKHARPPKVQLAWGHFISFWTVCTNLNVQFTMFKADGTPIRATAALSLMQADADLSTGRGSDPGPQNPTTRSDVRLHIHHVHDGDSLQSIAFKHFGDPTAWRRIAEVNDIDDPLRLYRGQVLSIPLEVA